MDSSSSKNHRRHGISQEAFAAMLEAEAKARTDAAEASSSTVDVDLTLINDLYEEIEQRPPAIGARRLLIQHCMATGWDGAARDAVKGLLRLLPGDDEGNAWALALDLTNFEQHPPVPTPAVLMNPWAAECEDVGLAKKQLMEGYEKLRLDSTRLRNEICELRKIARAREDDSASENAILMRLDGHFYNLDQLVRGKIPTVLRTHQLRSTRAVARDMERYSGKATDLAIADLQEFASWLRSPAQPTALDNDQLREALLKRIYMISNALPEHLSSQATVALMHVEHETLNRSYVNDETMYGDNVKDISRSSFLVTDDGYAWDMEELAQAITSASGVMRNPLSKQMFTPDDIRLIIKHPIGAGLRALQVEQDKLSSGVRPKTIEEMEKMADVLLADMSEDQMASRHVVDDFLAYVATLPDAEQKALDKLRVPAKDSHTGQGYDCTISEAVLDAKGNKVCFHKTGDFIRQAAAHLRKPA